MAEDSADAPLHARSSAGFLQRHPGDFSCVVLHVLGPVLALSGCAGHRGTAMALEHRPNNHSESRYGQTPSPLPSPPHPNLPPPGGKGQYLTGVLGAAHRGRLREAVVRTCLLCLLLVLVNYLAQRYPWRWDVTAARLHSLSEQTLGLLSALPQEVRVMAFYDDDHPARLRVQGLLQAYDYQNSQLHWEFVDPVR